MFLLCLASSALAFDHIAAVIDAGSTGSRVYIYCYSLTKKKVCFDDRPSSKKVSVPLSAFENTPEQAGGSLAGLLDHLLAFATSRRIRVSKVKVFLKATGGLREVRSKTAVDKILQSCLQTIATYPFPYTSDMTSVLPGLLEGFFG